MRDYATEIAEQQQRLRELRKEAKAALGYKPIVTAAQNFISMLGVCPDVEIASACGLTRERIRQIREAYGVPPFHEMRRKQIAEHAAEHGIEATTKALDVSASAVRHACHACGVIPAPRLRAAEKFLQLNSDILGKKTDREVAKITGRKTTTVSRIRASLGIPAQTDKIGSTPEEIVKRFTPEMDALLGTMTDSALAELLDLHHMTVWNRRKKLGIPPFRKRSEVAA